MEEIKVNATAVLYTLHHLRAPLVSGDKIL
jgi:hypothetical protein